MSCKFNHPSWYFHHITHLKSISASAPAPVSGQVRTDVSTLLQPLPKTSQHPCLLAAVLVQWVGSFFPHDINAHLSRSGQDAHPSRRPHGAMSYSSASVIGFSLYLIAFLYRSLERCRDSLSFALPLPLHQSHTAHRLILAAYLGGLVYGLDSSVSISTLP